MPELTKNEWADELYQALKDTAFAMREDGYSIGDVILAARQAVVKVDAHASTGGE